MGGFFVFKPNSDIIYRLNMKIAFFTDTFYPDLNGVTVSINNFTKILRKKGHTVYIFAPKIRGKYKDNDKNIIRLSSIKILSSSEPNVYCPLFFPNKEFLKMFTEDFDIVHAHGNGFYSLLGYFIAKIKRLPFVMTFHVMHTLYAHYLFKGKIITPKMISAILRIFANRCKTVFVPSLKMKEELIEYGLKKEIHVISNFLEIERFRNNRKGYLHDLLKFPKDIPFILTVGRIGKEKNIDFILRVFKEIAKTDKRTHLVIVGKGPEKDNLSNLADKLGISERVHFTGVIDYDSMPLVYSDSEIFVFASYTETQGVCILEAAASGVPCVANDDLAFKDALIDKENGFLLPLDEKKFAEKIILLLKNDKLRQEMSKKSIGIISKNFNGEKIADELIRIYHTL